VVGNRILTCHLSEMPAILAAHRLKTLAVLSGIRHEGTIDEGKGPSFSDRWLIFPGRNLRRREFHFGKNGMHNGTFPDLYSLTAEPGATKIRKNLHSLPVRALRVARQDGVSYSQNVLGPGSLKS
jgi:hypothetical protein